MFPANGLYGHIRKNNVKSALLLFSFLVLVGMLWFTCCLVWSGLTTKFEGIIVRLDGHRPTYSELLGFALDRAVVTALNYGVVPLLLVLGWFGVAFLCHRNLIRSGTGAQPIVRQLDPHLYNAVENLSISAGLPMPKVEIMETDALNAYASGLGPGDASVAVTRGLMEALTRDELAAVLAHEITHIKNRDVRLMVVATIFTGILAIGGQILARMAWPGNRTARAIAGTEVVLIVSATAVAAIASFFGLLTHFAISRTREFLADAGAVELTKNPDALISALQKISGHEEIPSLPSALQAMMISSRIGGLLSTHPAVEDRIAALEKFAGGLRTEMRRSTSRQQANAAMAFGARGSSAVADGRPFGVVGAMPVQRTFGRPTPESACAETRAWFAQNDTAN
jgi:heat shock protein HtpX